MKIYLTEEQKWFIIVVIAVFIFMIILAIIGFHAPARVSEMQDAQKMCGSKGVQSFTYHYNNYADETVPVVICK